MLEKFTGISLPGTSDPGIAERGDVPISKMIQIIREDARRNKILAESILEASDEDFKIISYRGIHVMRDHKIIQSGRSNPRKNQS